MKTIVVSFDLEGARVTARGSWERDLDAGPVAWTGPVERLRPYLDGDLEWPDRLTGEEMQSLPYFFQSLPGRVTILEEGTWQRMEQ